MQTVIVIVIYFLVFMFDLLPLIKEKNIKEVMIYAITFATSFVVLVLYTLDITVPSPSKFIQSTVQNIFNLKQ